MNKRLYLKDQTAKCLTEGATAFMIPWKEQPPNYYTYLGSDNHAANFFNFTGLPEFGMSFWKPYKLGHPLYLLETWRIVGYYPDNDQLSIRYKAGGMVVFEGFGMRYGLFPHNRWRSPATMPNKACRRVWKDWTIEGIQLETIKSPYNQLRERLKMTSGIEYWLEDAYPGLTMNSWMWLITKGGT